MADAEEVNIQQDLFCRCYTQNSVLFGNATLSYAEAYGHDLEELSRVREKDEKGKDIVGTSEYDKVYNMCSSNAWRLLKKDKIQELIRKYLNEFLRDDVVDGELIKLILQDADPTAKIASIREYNKLKKRVEEGKNIIIPVPIYGGKSTEDV